MQSKDINDPKLECLNEPELACLEMFRIALSENTQHARLQALKVMRHEVVSLGLGTFPIREGASATQENNPDFVRWIAKTAEERYEAAHVLNEIAQRYETKNERKLNVAEHIGKRVWLSILEQRFQGLHVAGGILEQVSDEAKAQGVHGARDKDGLREIWKTYRGVVHLGMAMDHCEDNPDAALNVLHVAERFRKALSQNCPKGTSKPYVDQSEQISFLYLSNI